MNSNKSIIISIYFEGLVNQIEAIQFSKDVFKTYYGKSFSELYYTVTDKTNKNWKQKTRGGKLTEKLFYKFTEQIKLITDGINVDFELLTNQKNSEYKSRDIDISISYNLEEKVKSITTIISVDYNGAINVDRFLMSLISFLLVQNCSVFYGLVFTMDNIKMPAFYVQGIRTENLTRGEEDVLVKWSDGVKNCDKKVWEIFWGNFLSKKHLNIDLIRNIKRIVGEENTFKYADDLFWFNLPEPLNSFELTNYSTKREELFRCFQDQNILP